MIQLIRPKTVEKEISATPTTKDGEDGEEGDEPPVDEWRTPQSTSDT